MGAAGVSVRQVGVVDDGDFCSCGLLNFLLSSEMGIMSRSAPWCLSSIIGTMSTADAWRWRSEEGTSWARVAECGGTSFFVAKEDGFEVEAAMWSMLKTARSSTRRDKAKGGEV